MPCGLATPETALQPFLGWSALGAGDLRPSATPMDTPRRTGLLIVEFTFNHSASGGERKRPKQKTVEGRKQSNQKQRSNRIRVSFHRRRFSEVFQDVQPRKEKLR
jgi:hypothetical protein